MAGMVACACMCSISRVAQIGTQKQCMTIMKWDCLDKRDQIERRRIVLQSQSNRWRKHPISNFQFLPLARDRHAREAGAEARSKGPGQDARRCVEVSWMHSKEANE